MNLVWIEVHMGRSVVKVKIMRMVLTCGGDPAEKQWACQLQPSNVVVIANCLPDPGDHLTDQALKSFQSFSFNQSCVIIFHHFPCINIQNWHWCIFFSKYIFCLRQNLFNPWPQNFTHIFHNSATLYWYAAGIKLSLLVIFCATLKLVTIYYVHCNNHFKEKVYFHHSTFG